MQRDFWSNRKRKDISEYFIFDFFSGPLTTAAGQAMCFFDVDKEGNYILSNKMPEVQIFMTAGPFIDDPDDEVLSRFNEFANFGPLLVRLCTCLVYLIFLL